MVCHSVCDICALGISSISSMKGVEEVSRQVGHHLVYRQLLLVVLPGEGDLYEQPPGHALYPQS